MLALPIKCIIRVPLHTPKSDGTTNHFSLVYYLLFSLQGIQLIICINKHSQSEHFRCNHNHSNIWGGILWDVCINLSVVKLITLETHPLRQVLFQQTEGFPLIKWIHSDFMYVRFGGMRNTKTSSNFNFQ